MCFLRAVHAAATQWTDIILSHKTSEMWRQVTGRVGEPTEAGLEAWVCPIFKVLLRGDWWDVIVGWHSLDALNLSRFQLHQCGGNLWDDYAVLTEYPKANMWVKIPTQTFWRPISFLVHWQGWPAHGICLCTLICLIPPGPLSLAPTRN